MVKTAKQPNPPASGKAKTPATVKPSTKPKQVAEVAATRHTAKRTVSASHKESLTGTAESAESKPATSHAPRGKLGEIIAQPEHPEGATLADLMAITGWQAHSVRGMLSTLKKRLGRPLSISLTDDGLRLYRLEAR